MKRCPHCDADLGDTALACACGWKDRKFSKPSEPTVRIPCCSPTCVKFAICRIEIAGRIMPLCYDHYQAYFTEKAKETCRKLGLDTTAKKRDWVMANVSKLARKIRPDYLPERQPGEDEEFTYLQA